MINKFFAVLVVSIFALPFVASAQNITLPSTLTASSTVQSKAQADPAFYRYNRITAEYTVNKDGSVDVAELFTMYYHGDYHSAWRVIPNATSTTAASTTVSDIAVYDGSTGQKLIFVDTPPTDATKPENWGVYAVVGQPSGTAVEWIYNTKDIVHTWVLRYTLHNATTVGADGQVQFVHDIFSEFGAPVDTVEAQVTLPQNIDQATGTISTTGRHGSYSDHPSANIIRFRVSDIAAGETVSITMGWQQLPGGLLDIKDSLSPEGIKSYFSSLTLKGYLIGAIIVFVVLGSLVLMLRRRRSK